MIERKTRFVTTGIKWKGQIAVDSERKVLSVAQVANELGLCSQTVYDLVRDGKLQAVRFNRRVLITRAALDKLLQDSVSAAA